MVSSVSVPFANAAIVSFFFVGRGVGGWCADIDFFTLVCWLQFFC